MPSQEIQTAIRLEGKTPAKAALSHVLREAESFRSIHGRRPELAIYCAQADFASNVYVARKLEAGARAGIGVTLHGVPSGEPAEGWAARVLPGLEDQVGVDGAILQLPVDGLDDPRQLLDLIPPRLDVDCLTAENLGLLAQGRPRYPSCTPTGIIRLLDWHGIPIAGETILIINDSLIVGRPLALLLMGRGATVSVCHRRSRPEDIRMLGHLADIVVVGVGIPGFLTPDMIRPGATVVDVGINRMPGGAIVGDADPAVWFVAGAMTPVPGGVGPCTVSCLMENLLKAAVLQSKEG